MQRGEDSARSGSVLAPIFPKCLQCAYTKKERHLAIRAKCLFYLVLATGIEPMTH